MSNMAGTPSKQLLATNDELASVVLLHTFFIKLEAVRTAEGCGEVLSSVTVNAAFGTLLHILISRY